MTIDPSETHLADTTSDLQYVLIFINFNIPCQGLDYKWFKPLFILRSYKNLTPMRLTL